MIQKQYPDELSSQRNTDDGVTKKLCYNELSLSGLSQKTFCSDV